METELIYTNVASKEVMITYAIPTYKRAKYILETIDSIIQQNLKLGSYEILVVNNDPDADMSYLVERYSEYHISIYRNSENIGMVNNLNLSIKLSKGKYVSMIHDDDMICSNYNQEIVGLITKDEHDVIISKRYNLYSEPKNAKRALLKKLLFGTFVSENRVPAFNPADSIYCVMNVFLGPTCGTVFKKTVFLKAGLFDTRYPYAFDFYTFQNMLENGYRFTTTKDYVGIYRMIDSASNKPSVSFDFFTCFYDLLQKYKNANDNTKLKSFIVKFEKEILYLRFSRFSAETQEMIANKYGTRYEDHSKLKYIILSISRSIYYYQHYLNIAKPYISSK